MPRQRLSDASAARAAQKAKSGIAKSSPSASVSSAAKADLSSKSAIEKGAIPGLPALTVDGIQGFLPSVKPEAYTVTDPHKLSDSLPQVDDAQMAENERIAHGVFNAQKSDKLALQIIQGKFEVEGQKAKTIGAGIKTVHEIAKVEGLLLDLKNQEQVNLQKADQLDFNTYKTSQEAQILVHERDTLDERLSQAEKKAILANAETQSLDKKMVEKLAELGIGKK